MKLKLGSNLFYRSFYVAFFTCIVGLLVSCDQPSQELNKEYPLPSEDEEFRLLATRINEVQKQISDEDRVPLARAFHAKAHGCLKGEFVVLPLDPNLNTKFGIFAETKTYPVWVRFSNGSGHHQNDTYPSVRGLAIKVMGVDGKKLLGKETDATTQDFVMINIPTGVTRNAMDFVDFAEAAAPSSLWLSLYGITPRIILFGITHPKSGLLFSKLAWKQFVSPTVPSLLTERYWSGTPILLGSNAIKFSVIPSHEKPCAPFEKRLPKTPGEDYLREDLILHAGNHSICFDFYVQFQTDPVKTPIEDALVEWDEDDAPFINTPVARLILPPQKFDSKAQTKFCDELNMTPWHAISEHRPLGEQNRARKIIYEKSQEFREGGERTSEPDGSERF